MGVEFRPSSTKSCAASLNDKVRAVYFPRDSIPTQVCIAMSASQSTLTVTLGERSYPIHIGVGLLADTALLARVMPARKVALVTNAVVAPLYSAAIKAARGERDLVGA